MSGNSYRRLITVFVSSILSRKYDNSEPRTKAKLRQSI